MGLEQYIIAFVTFTNNIVIPFLLGMAFLFLVINVFRFFIIGGANTDSQEKARALALYGVGAFVLIIIFWGIINILTSSLGLAQYATSNNTCFDYDPLCNSGVSLDTGPSGRGGLTGEGAAEARLDRDMNAFADLESSADEARAEAERERAQAQLDQMSALTALEDESERARIAAALVALEAGEASGPTYEVFKVTESTLRPVAANFAERDAERLFGYLSDQVVADLYADLPFTTRDDIRFNDTDRVRASKRLALTGEITNNTALQYQGQLESYYREIISFNDPEGIIPDFGIVADIPQTIQTEINVTTRLIEDELIEYYGSTGLGLSQQQVAQNVQADLRTVSTGTTQERFNALENLYDQNILRDANNVIYDRFVEDLNVQNIYAGNNPDF
jgi:hypothetical protein